MILVIDNYDSFTYNLVQYLGELGAEPYVVRNDALDVDGVAALKPERIVISPGPGTPDQAGVSLDVIHRLGAHTPILGVCLGHQAIGQVYGGKVIRAPKPMHGKLSKVHHTGKGVFRDVPNDFDATRYHSLTVEPSTFPSELEITAQSEDGVIQGLQHKTLPIFGVQFHPESIASEHGHKILANFLQDCGTNLRMDKVA